jgi:tRNA-2-methylthio-N6-dimethylallyladenosine synthase
MSEKKKLFIKTYGCQMNVYDSERMGDVLSPLGYQLSDTPEEAEVIILNTCHIREKAAEKVYSELGRIRKIKDQRSQEGKTTIVGVAGCVAQAEGEEMLARAPIVDLLVGPQAYHRLPDMVRKIETGARGLLEVDFPADDKFEKIPNAKSAQIIARGPSAFVTVQEGCDKFCTFCVVPYTRGSEFSRPVEKIVAEVKRLCASGVKEITLLGQNVNAYHGTGPAGDSWSLGRLVYALAEVSGLERLRYTTSHPLDMDDVLIAAHGELPQLMPYLHLPVQSGSNTILAAMNRKHTTTTYFDAIERIRKARPDIALSSDFIVGFPGESDADFEATMQLVRDVEYSQAFSFKYSPRPGTPAADMENQVEEAVKSARLTELQVLLRQQQHDFNCNCLGRTLPVLFTGKGRKPGQLIGRSPYLQPVHAQAAEEFIGAIHEVGIIEVGTNSLSGQFAKTGENGQCPHTAIEGDSQERAAAL